MQKYTKPLFSEDQLGLNPFVVSLQIPVAVLQFKNQYRKEGDVLINVEKEVESTVFAKLYCSAERRVLANNLSLRSKELLVWVMYEIDSGKDYLWINKARYMEEIRITAIDTYRNALKELIRYGFMHQSLVKDVYWINPDMFFKGDRIKRFPTKIVMHGSPEHEAMKKKKRTPKQNKQDGSND